MDLPIGIRGSRSLVVSVNETAAALGSGLLAVFATPAMIALMEDTAASSVQELLPAGCSSVGVHIDVKHLSATPAGLTVHCETELIKLEGRRMTFFCRAFTDAETIGEGTQERVIVDNDRFMEKAAAKRG